MLETSRDNIRKQSEKENCKVYRIDSKPLEGKELEQSPEESKTFLVETSPKVDGIYKMLESLQKDNREFKQKIREHEVTHKELQQTQKEYQQKIREHEVTHKEFQQTQKEYQQKIGEHEDTHKEFFNKR